MKKRVLTGVVPFIAAVIFLLCAAGAAAGEGLTRPGEEGWMSDFRPSSDDAQILDYIETQELFAALSDKTLIASSGAGAWEGRLNVDSSGGFEGYYYDADAGDEVIYEVSFSGRFAPNAEVHGYGYWLWVAELTTRNVPGTTAPGAYGDRIEYTDAPFAQDRFLVLTLINTPDEQIPETVRGEIGGTYGEWDHYSRFVTLTRQEDGWGFFADGYESDRQALPEPVPTAAQSGAPAPAESAGPAEDPAQTEFRPEEWTGCWMTGDDAKGEMIVTPGSDGGLHMKVFFLRTFEMDAELKHTGGGRCSFETEYGHYTGSVTREKDGTLRFAVSGGMSMEDDENEMYYFFRDREYVFRKADYADLWYEGPADAYEDEEDWLGEWRAVYGELTSTLRVVRGSDGGYVMQISFSTGYAAAGTLTATDSRTADFSAGEEFSAMLTLNRKKNAILMSEIGSTSDDAYRWLDRVGGAVEYYAVESAVPFVTATPQPKAEATREPVQATAYDAAEAVLIPIPGRSGYRQVPVAYVNATSYIVGKDPTAYMPFRMTDGEETTSYQFSTKETRLGNAYMYFDFSLPSAMDELWIKNGFWKKTSGQDQYLRNCRVKTMTVEFRYAGSEDYLDPQKVTLKDDKNRRDWTMIALGRKTNVAGIRIRVDEIYTGSKFKNDVCVSEVMFVKKD